MPGPDVVEALGRPNLLCDYSHSPALPQVLFRSGADLNHRNYKGQTVLHGIASFDSLAAFDETAKTITNVLRKLEESRSWIATEFAVATAGLRPKHFNIQLDAFQRLVPLRADINVRDNEGRVPLDLASVELRSAVEKWLEKRGKEERDGDSAVGERSHGDEGV